MPGDKELKISLGADESSFSRTGNLIRSLISDLNRLVEVAAKAGQALGNLGGGGFGGGGGMLSMSGRAGITSPQQARAIAAVPAIGRPLVQNVLDNKNLFAGLASGSKDSMGLMTTALKQAVSNQKQEIEKLDRAIQGLEGTYESLGKKMKEVGQYPIAHLEGGVASQYSNMPSEYVMAQGGRATAVKNLATLENLLPSGPATKGGFFSYGGFGAGQFGGGIKGMASGMGGRLLQGLGIPGGAFKSAGLAGTGAFVAAALLDTELNRNPFRFLDYTAQKEQLAFGEVNPILQGDTRNLGAYNDIMRDPNKAQDYRDINGGWRRFRTSAWNIIKHPFDTTEWGRSFSGEVADLSVRRERQEAMETQRKTDPLDDLVRGEMNENFRGRMSAMRALGMGPNNLKDKGSGYRMMARMRSWFPNFDEGEIVSAKTGIEGAGTRAASFGALWGNTLQAQAAGIGGAAATGGAMSRFGAGVGNNFLNALRVAGGGGMDVVTAGMLGQFVAQNAPAVQGQTGLGALGMLSMGPTHGAEGRLVAEQNMAGFGALQKTLSGSTDGYQDARNLQIAMTNAPGLGIYGQEYLANKISLSQMADVAGGGKLSPFMKASGVTKELIIEQFKGSTKSLYERMMIKGLQGSPAFGTVKSMMDSDLDPTTWFKQQSKIKGFDKEQAVADYGFARAASSPEGMTEAEGLGEARVIFGFGRTASTTGKKVGDVAGGSLEAKQAGKEVEKMGKKADIAATMLEKFTNELEASVFVMMKHNEWGKLKEGDRAKNEEALSRLMGSLDGKPTSFEELEKGYKKFRTEIAGEQAAAQDKAEAPNRKRQEKFGMSR